VQTLAHGKEFVTAHGSVASARRVGSLGGSRPSQPATAGRLALFSGNLMDRRVTPSCWGVMTWTVVALGMALVLANLLGGFGGTEIAMN
jgi:hypothetical protein